MLRQLFIIYIRHCGIFASQKVEDNPKLSSINALCEKNTEVSVYANH